MGGTKAIATMKNFTTTETDKVEFTIGINPGYFHNNTAQENLVQFNNLYMKVAAEVLEQTGIYISAVSTESKCLYHREWGCPDGGEETFSVTATRNPKFCPDSNNWVNSVVEVVKRLKAELKQSTVTIEFSKVQILYLT